MNVLLSFQTRRALRGWTSSLIFFLALGTFPDTVLSQLTGIGWTIAAKAGSKDDDRQREQLERAREQMQQAQERAREAARQSQERAREAMRQSQQRSSDNKDNKDNKDSKKDDRGDDNKSDTGSRTSERTSNSRTEDNGDNRSNRNARSDDAGDDRNGKSDRSERGDKSERSEKSEKSEKRGKSEGNSKTVEVENPPATIQELFQRLTGQSQTTEEGKQSATTQPSTSTTPKSTVAPSKSAARPTPAPLTMPPATTFMAREVLALNPTAETLRQAKSLGFDITRTTVLPGLRLSITRLTPPANMNSFTAQQVLNGAIADSSFALNRVYRPYRAATATNDQAARDPVPATTSGGCAPERCYAKDMIGWSATTRSCTVGMKIGVIDTIVDHHHPAFDKVSIKVGTFLRDGRKPAPSAHGTGILALLAGGEQSGTPGLIPHAEFFIGDIFHVDSDGLPSGDTVSLLSALEWMDRFDIKVINLSVAGPHDDLMQQAIETLSAKGVVFAAAAGNEGPGAPPAYPAAYKQVVAVTAIARDRRSYRRANRGDYIDIAAPGVDVWTAAPGAKETYQSGTSFAVPFATAALASVYNKAKRKTKDGLLAELSYDDLGPPGRNPIYGRGLLKAPKGCGPAPNVDEPAAPVASAPVASVPTLWNPSVSYGFASSKP